jgi:hypothetical protein
VIGIFCDRRPSQTRPTQAHRLVSPAARFLACALCVLLTSKQPRRTVIPVPVHAVSTRYTTKRCSCDDAASSLVSPSHHRTTTVHRRPSPQRPRCLALPCPAFPHTPRRLDVATPDAPVCDRIAHIVSRHALGYGDQQSLNCASHRWRAQTCSTKPERSRPVQTGPGQLVEAVQEERQEAAGPGRYAHISSPGRHGRTLGSSARPLLPCTLLQYIQMLIQTQRLHLESSESRYTPPSVTPTSRSRSSTMKAKATSTAMYPL